jgi:hypothetical protein
MGKEIAVQGRTRYAGRPIEWLGLEGIIIPTDPVYSLIRSY